MRKKSFYTIGLLIFFSSILRISSQQLNTNNKSKNTDDLNPIKIDSTLVASNPISINDTLVKKEPLLLDQIKYTAKDSVKIDQKNSKIYLYNKAGYEVPGISKRDLKAAVDFVSKNKDVELFANEMLLMTKNSQWVKPDEFWDVGSILKDLNTQKNHFIKT